MPALLRRRPLLAALCLLLSASAFAAPRLYWFIPDGMRADPYQFDVFKLAEEGRYPNIKKMMDNGAYGYSIPTFPGHTPVNFATLLTGAYPEVHGVSDGPMRVEGAPLDKPSISGFSSTAKRVPAIWRIFERRGLKVALVSIPGSTPPELDAGITIRGRFGGWGADLHALIFETKRGQRAKRGDSVRLFYNGPELTRYVPALPASGWSRAPRSAVPPLELAMEGYGTTVYALVYAPPREAGYGRVRLSLDKKTTLAELSREGQWTDWKPIAVHWGGAVLQTHFKACLIKLDAGGLARIRLLYDVLNPLIVEPGVVADEIEKGVGPMVDFPDNWPAQMNRYSEDKGPLLAEAHMALDWHRRLLPFFYKKYAPDVLIQDTYTPNQMLESRWWLRYLDKDAPDYGTIDEAKRARLRSQIEGIYAGLDKILGAAIKAAGPNAYIVLSSDHGVIPIKREVRINNLLARMGLLHYTRDPATGEPRIEWARTTAIHLKMIGIYVKPSGLAGPWKRGRGRAYRKLRARVMKALCDLKDADGTPVFNRVIPWEQAGVLRLPKDRVPDIILNVHPGYYLTEEMGDGKEIFATPIQSGYKQALDPATTPGLWTPFIVMGPGVKKGYRIPKPIRHIDQAPTLLTLMGVPVPSYMQGRVLDEILAKPGPVSTH